MQTQDLKLTIENGIANLIFDMKESNANTLSKSVLEQFETILNSIKTDKAIKVLVISSAKENIFIAGANLQEIYPMQNRDEIYTYLLKVNEIFLSLEELPFPSIALINGACMGGGLELALSCTYRLATTNEKTQLAFPEIKLGFFPGFGGTQRLPKLVGLLNALDMILSAKTLNAQKAYRMGLVTEFFAQGYTPYRLNEFIKKIQNNTIKVKKPIRWIEYFNFTREFVFKKALENLQKKVHPKYFGPYAALDVIHHTFKLPHKEGIKIEAQTFSDLAITPESKNLISLFFTTESLKKEYSNTNLKSKISETAVIGSGVMGKEIIWLFSKYTNDVRIKLRKLDQVENILRSVSKLYDYFVKSKKMSKKEVAFKLNKLSYTDEFKGFKLIDFALEAIIENKEEKIKTYAALEENLSKDAIIATNTSSISIESLSQGVKNKNNFLGVHFFNPVHKMPLVEVIPTTNTSQKTIETTFEFLKRCGKTPVLVHDCAGFLVNRILLPYINEAGFILGTGTGVLKVDNTLKEFGMPMGAFMLADVVGIDVGYKVAEILEQSYGSRMEICPILKKVHTDLKLLGKKSGKGFYIHSKKGEIKVNRAVEKHISSTKIVTTQDIIDRTIFIMINEASRCLEEGIIEKASYLDYAMVAGTGFPAFRGGLLRYADSIGLDYVIKKLEEFEKSLGKRFNVSELLYTLQKNKKTFYTGEALWKH
ncbi:MAG: 3-hydroxyacyl-CoA dehydrogenase NAD-binding domain-containing protein [Candidatus Marinarcus sp.]|uniref:3-hydroxyacyl-CoA dehydrogenase NAD-binding domain-containing protein n=1 Tax=Candidatus Marinarcus sp. TaxID=3100987 RepID=UPI003AFFAD07